MQKYCIFLCKNIEKYLFVPKYWFTFVMQTRETVGAHLK